MLPIISVLILTWNNATVALRCLHSIRATGYPNLEIIVVDNASIDKTVIKIRQHFPKVQLIQNHVNLGFGRGCNVGLQKLLTCNAEYVMLLNQDTVIDKTMFQELVKAVKFRPQAGILAPKTYFLDKMSDGSERLMYAGAWRGRLPFQQRIAGITLADDGSYDIPRLVDYCWGHGMFIRTDMLRNIGLFDAQFFMYFEDLDLCRRATKAGYEIWYIPQARMWHNFSHDERDSMPELWRFQYQTTSLLICYRKYYGTMRGYLLTTLHVLDEVRQTWQRGYPIAAQTLLRAFTKTLIGVLV